jgi:bifunctional non-homologous end joining protein LigD
LQWAQVVETAHVVNETLRGLGMPTYVKTTGSRGVHIYVPIVRGPTQKAVWTVAKTISLDIARRHPRLATAVYRKEARPRDRVHVDFNQNAWGRTLASVYSVRPRPRAPVSTPVTWEELAGGVTIADFRLDNVPARVQQVGDLWAPVAAGARRGRFDLSRLTA